MSGERAIRTSVDEKTRMTSATDPRGVEGAKPV
jgi:hypothetical protein